MQFRLIRLFIITAVASLILYGAIQTGQIGPNEEAQNEKIYSILDKHVTLKFDPTTIQELADELSEQYKIRVAVSASVDGNALLTSKYFSVASPLKLKNSLRIALRSCEAIFVVQNGKLIIISIDEADELMSTQDTINPGDLPGVHR